MRVNWKKIWAYIYIISFSFSLVKSFNHIFCCNFLTISIYQQAIFNKKNFTWYFLLLIVLYHLIILASRKICNGLKSYIESSWCSNGSQFVLRWWGSGREDTESGYVGREVPPRGCESPVADRLFCERVQSRRRGMCWRHLHKKEIGDIWWQILSRPSACCW